MFKSRPAGPASAVDQNGRPGSESRPQGRRGATIGHAFDAGSGLLARVVHVVVSIVCVDHRRWTSGGVAGSPARSTACSPSARRGSLLPSTAQRRQRLALSRPNT